MSARRSRWGLALTGLLLLLGAQTLNTAAAGAADTADLAVTKTDGVTSAIAGGGVT
jgi:hypothetical protein